MEIIQPQNERNSIINIILQVLACVYIIYLLYKQFFVQINLLASSFFSSFMLP